MKLQKRLFLFLTLFLLLAGMTTAKVSAASLTLSQTSAKMYAGDKLKLKLEGTTKKITWTSSDPSVAKVNQKGRVTALKKGSAVIKARVGKKTRKCLITVKRTMTCDKKKVTFEGTSTQYLTLKLKKPGSLSWQNSNPSVAKCSWTNKWTDNDTTTRLKIKALNAGETTITLTNTYSKETYQVKVTVK